MDSEPLRNELLTSQWAGISPGNIFYTGGSVGIGTITPAYILDVIGQSRIGNPALVTDASTVLRLTTSGGASYIQTGTALTGGSVGDTVFTGIFATPEFMRIKSTGFVGIGTNNPLFKFVVDNGTTTGINAVIQSSGITAGQNMSLLIGKSLAANNCGTILWNHVGDGLATNYLGFGYYGGDNKLVLTAGGYVGIGIVAPNTGATLHVYNSTYGGQIGVGQQNDSTAYTRIGMDTAWGTYIAQNCYWTGSAWNYVATGGYGGLAVMTYMLSGTWYVSTASGGTNPLTWATRLYVANGGNVGINQTGPAAQLHITGYSASGGSSLGHLLVDYPNSGAGGGNITVRNSSGATNAFSSIAFEVDGSTSYDGTNLANGFIYCKNISSTNNRSSLGFQCWTGGAQLEFLNLNWNGNSNGACNMGNCIWSNPQGDADSRNYITNKDCTNPGTNCDARLNIQDRASVYIRFIGGNTGTVTLYGSITQSGANTLYNATSDYRLKSNINSITDGLTVINKLAPKTFTFNSHPDQVTAGFIAHEVQDILPNCVNGEKDAVSDDGSILPQGLDKSYMVTYLVAAVQQLSSKVDALEARLKKAGL